MVDIHVSVCRCMTVHGREKQRTGDRMEREFIVSAFSGVAGEELCESRALKEIQEWANKNQRSQHIPRPEAHWRNSRPLAHGDRGVKGQALRSDVSSRCWVGGFGSYSVLLAVRWPEFYMEWNENVESCTWLSGKGAQRPPSVRSGTKGSYWPGQPAVLLPRRERLYPSSVLRNSEQGWLKIPFDPGL